MVGGDDEADAGGAAAAAGVGEAFAPGITVVEGEFRAAGDGGEGDEEDTAILDLDVAVSFSGVVDEAGGGDFVAAVDDGFVVGDEEVIVGGVVGGVETSGFWAEAFAAASLGLGDAFTGVFDQGGAGGDGASGVNAAAVDGGLAGDGRETVVGEESEARASGVRRHRARSVLRLFGGGG